MSEAQKRIFDSLDTLGIMYKVTNHEAVFTIEQMDALKLENMGHVAKNLFLRDAKGKRHFLVTMRGDKQADLKELGAKIGCSRLSFASEERLQRFLCLKKGSVTPLGVINDSQHCVEVILDRDLAQEKTIGVHPNENTATIWMAFEDLYKFVADKGNDLSMMEL